jgi:hypothetical protein
MPCICNSTFFRQCPPAKYCIENIIVERDKSTTKPPPKHQRNLPGSQNRPDTSAPNPYEPDGYGSDPYGPDPYGPYPHDYYDPDHVPDWYDMPPFYEQTPAFRGDVPPYTAPARPTEPISTTYPVPDGAKEDTIIRHRKVYVSPKSKGDVPIHPIKIRIPVRMPEYVEPNLPDPKPVYKFKKYTTYESRPEIQMVPVIKTIIKPVGVTPDQIIEEPGTKKTVGKVNG